MSRRNRRINSYCQQLEEEKYHTKVSTYKQKIIPVKYNELIIKKKYIRFYSSDWVYIIHTVKFYCESESDIWYFGQSEIPKHPLVDKGNGFWINTSEIVTGYRLRSNPSITRPIYNYKRELMFRKVKLYIHRYMKFHMAFCWLACC